MPLSPFSPQNGFAPIPGNAILQAAGMSELIRLDGRSWQMAYVITDECTACGTCVETCPVEAISEGDPIYKIDPDTCVDCGQCVDACPADAIKEE